MHRLALKSAVSQLVAHILGLLLLGVTLGVQEVGEEEQFDDDKKDEDLDGDDKPQRLAHSHAAEAIVIQMKHPRPESLLLHLIVTHGQTRGLNSLTSHKISEKN